MGDFNAVVGRQISHYTCLGKFGYGNMNSRGEKLIEFCEQYKLIISNTVHEVPYRRSTLVKHQVIKEDYKLITF
jgi:hypothetical protein